MTILPCRDPPGVHVVVRDRNSNRRILNRVVDRTIRGIDLGGSGATLDVTLNQLTNAIGVQVHVRITTAAQLGLKKLYRHVLKK